MKAGAAPAVGRDFTKGSILKHLAVFGLPLLLANLLQQLYNAVDIMVIGRYVGSIGTVGVSNGGEAANFISFVAISFGSAGQIYVSQLSGAKDDAGIKETVGTLLTFTFAMSLVFTALSVIFCRPLLNWLNTQPEAMGQAIDYMIIVSLGLPAVFGYNAVCGLMRGMGEAKYPLIFIAVAAVTNIVLDVILVKYIPLAAAGTAIATAAAQYASFAASVIFMYRHRGQFDFDFRLRSFKMIGRRLKVIVELGVPLTVQTALIHITQLFCTSRINGYGLVESATNSIGNRIYRLIHVVMSSVATGTGAMVGQNLGARQYDRAKKVVYVSFAFSAVVAVLESALCLLLPRQIFRIFTVDEAVIEFGVVYMRCLVIVFVLSAFQYPFQAMVTGSGNARLGFISGMIDGVILRLGISLPLSAAIGVTGYFIGNNMAHLGPAVISIVYFYSGAWKRRALLGEKK